MQFVSRIAELRSNDGQWWLHDSSSQSRIAAVSDRARLTPDSALVVTAPDSESELAPVLAALPRSGDAAAVIVTGGTALTRTLVSEHAGLRRGLATIQVGGDRDVAATLILSGRCDAVILSE